MTGVEVATWIMAGATLVLASVGVGAAVTRPFKSIQEQLQGTRDEFSKRLEKIEKWIGFESHSPLQTERKNPP